MKISKKDAGFWVLVFSLILGVGAGCYTKKEDSAPQNAAQNLKTAPDFELKNENGKAVALHDFKDRWVVIHFWASWCGPCVPEIPELLGFSKTHLKDAKNRDIEWFFVSADESIEAAKRVLKPASLPSSGVLVLDEKGRVAELFATYQYPETYLLAPDHTVVKKWVGAQEWKSVEFTKGFESALGQF